MAVPLYHRMYVYVRLHTGHSGVEIWNTRLELHLAKKSEAALCHNAHLFLCIWPLKQTAKRARLSVVRGTHEDTRVRGRAKQTSVPSYINLSSNWVLNRQSCTARYRFRTQNAAYYCKHCLHTRSQMCATQHSIEDIATCTHYRGWVRNTHGTEAKWYYVVVATATCEGSLWMWQWSSGLHTNESNFSTTWATMSFWKIPHGVSKSGQHYAPKFVLFRETPYYHTYYSHRVRISVLRIHSVSVK